MPDHQLSLMEACFCGSPAAVRIRWMLRSGGRYQRICCPEHVEEVLAAARASEHVMGGTIRQESV